MTEITVDGDVKHKQVVLHNVANSADLDEMPHNASFHLGLHYLLKYPFWD